MKHAISLKHIAGLYLDLYSTPRDLERPLTPEQVQEAGRLFLDLITTYEADALIERERQRQAEKLPSYHEIAEMFAARYRQDKGITGNLTEDDWYAASDVFLGYISAQ
jgi:hypothetical protein